ncbi:MAG: DUF222 domain-containing protein [Acidimicrobiales bacterium]
MAVAIDAANAALDSLAVAGMVASDARDAVTLVREVESLVRRARSLAVAVVDGIDRAGWHRADGHASAKVMVRHVARLSAAEAGRRMADAKALRDLPEVAAAYRAGRIGSDQVDRIGRLHANPRVSGKVGGQDRNLVQASLHLSYREFDLKVSEWERLVDEDGARDRNQAHHDKRDASMSQDWDGRWRFTGSCGSLAGTLMYEIHKAFYEAETLTDWEGAPSTAAATVEHLPRTDAQRRFDAWAAIFEKAAAAQAAEPGGSIVVANIVIDQATFEEEVRRFAGAAPSPDRPEPDIDPQPDARLRCATVDGGHVDPTEAGGGSPGRPRAAGGDRCRRGGHRPRAPVPGVHRPGQAGGSAVEHRVLLARLPRAGLPLRGRPPETLVRPRTGPNLTGQRWSGVRPPQPLQGARLHGVAGPGRNHARAQTRRHRGLPVADRVGDRTSEGQPSRRSGWASDRIVSRSSGRAKPASMAASVAAS